MKAFHLRYRQLCSPLFVHKALLLVRTEISVYIIFTKNLQNESPCNSACVCQSRVSSRALGAADHIFARASQCKWRAMDFVDEIWHFEWESWTSQKVRPRVSWLKCRRNELLVTENLLRVSPGKCSCWGRKWFLHGCISYLESRWIMTWFASETMDAK